MSYKRSPTNRSGCILAREAIHQFRKTRLSLISCTNYSNEKRLCTYYRTLTDFLYLSTVITIASQGPGAGSQPYEPRDRPCHHDLFTCRAILWMGPGMLSSLVGFVSPFRLPRKTINPNVMGTR